MSFWFRGTCWVFALQIQRPILLPVLLIYKEIQICINTIEFFQNSYTAKLSSSLFSYCFVLICLTQYFLCELFTFMWIIQKTVVCHSRLQSNIVSFCFPGIKIVFISALIPFKACPVLTVSGLRLLFLLLRKKQDLNLILLICSLFSLIPLSL